MDVEQDTQALPDDWMVVHDQDRHRVSHGEPPRPGRRRGAAGGLPAAGPGPPA
jgi:hypothetical protein